MTRQCSSRFERAARQLGWTRIAGIDEAGRGALFGPVVAAAVILNPKRRIVGLDDSKKLASDRRFELAERIREHAFAWAVAEVDAARIDAWNIYQASRQAMTAALQQLTVAPDYLLIDAMGRRVPRLWLCPTQGLWDAGAPRSPEAPRAYPFAPPFICASSRGRLLVDRRNPDATTHLLAPACPAGSGFLSATGITACSHMAAPALTRPSPACSFTRAAGRRPFCAPKMSRIAAAF